MSTLVQNVAKVKSAYDALSASIEAKGVSVPAGTKLTGMPALVDQIQTGGGGGQDYGYLTFTAVEATTLTLKQNGGIAPHKLLKSNDAVTWTKWENPSINGISLNVGESVYLKADEDASNRTATGESDYNCFQSTGPISCIGDIMSIVNISNSEYNFFLGYLFNRMGNLTHAPELKPITSVKRCYSNMFDHCTSLIKPPSVVQVNSCEFGCNGMFYNCNKMTTPPELPSKKLSNECYQWMFGSCSSLKTAPVLPATTLADWCYSNMFYDCTSLTTAPELPATTLAYGCYQEMFRGCSSFTQAPELPATTLANNCYNGMFQNCSSLTQAPELPATTLADQCYYNMFASCTSLVVAPELPATTVTGTCYQYMFYGCTSLKRIKMNASSGSWGTGMFNGCTSLELVDMTGSTDVPTLATVNNFVNTNDTYKIVVPDSLYNTWVNETNWASIADHIMKQSDWNNEHPDDILGQ